MYDNLYLHGFEDSEAVQYVEHSEELCLPHATDQVNWIFDLEDIPMSRASHGELEEASSA